MKIKLKNVISKPSFYALVLSVIVCISCTTEKNNIVFSLEGKLYSNDQENIWLYQATGPNANELNIIDTLTVDADSRFSESYNLEPHFYHLRINDSLDIPFIADSGQTITIHFLSEDNYQISGSPDTDLFEEYEQYRTNILSEMVYPIRGQLNDLLDNEDLKNSARIEELGNQVVKAEATYRDTLINAVKKMGTSIAIYPTMVRWNGDKHMEYYEKLAADFSKQHEGLKIAELVSEKVRILKQVSIGGKVSDIVAEDTSGVERSLFDNLGRYTLIDFFGSWCGPCRSESDHLARMYKQYKGSGFEIFGFGVEYEKQSWLHAIDKDNRSWINVSTVDGYSSDIAAEYSITSLPKNFLVDENGIILAKDIHGEELEEKLADLFSDK